MTNRVKQNFMDFCHLLGKIEATGRQGETVIFEDAVEEAVRLLLEKAGLGGQVFFIGNGGSAAIASHMAIDFWKNAGLKAMAFNDSAALTCVGNDFGYQHIFEKPIEMFGQPQDVLIAISSSGRSENILRGAQAALAKGMTVLTLSGFKPDNPLRTLGRINFYVPAPHYGHVECAHHVLCHSFVNLVLLKNTKTQEKAASL